MAGSLGTIAGQVRLDAAQAIAAFAAVRAASSSTRGSLTAAGGSLSTFGKVSMGAGLALVAGFGVAVKAAADFEKKMDYFGAVNNATAEDMEKVRAKALQLGRDSQFSAGQIADAFVEMGKAGVQVKDITGGLADAIVNMAAAADIKLDQATNIVTSQIQTYGLSVKDAAHITDLFAGAANASIVDVEDLGVSLKYVGGVAHALGISFDSTVTALSLLGKAGIKGSTAGTSLRQIMVSLAGGTNKAKGVLEDLGIITLGPNGVLNNAFFDASGKAKSLDQVFQILQDHTRGLSQEAQLMAFRTIFNNRALAAAEILTHAGATGFAQMNAEMSKTTAADVAAKRMDNLSGDIKKLKSSIDTLMIEGGGPFQNMLRGIVQSITRLINAFMNMPAGIQTSILSFMLIAGVILSFLGAVALIGGTVMKAIAAFKQMWAALKLLWTITRLVTVATWEATAAALANPYVLVAIAVIALVTAFILLYKHSERFRQIMNTTAKGIKTGFMATIHWFETLPSFFENLWKTISSWFATGVGWVKGNWDILLTIMTGPIGGIILVWRRFGDEIVNFFKAIPGAVTSFTQQAVAASMNFAKNLPYYIGYAIGFTIGVIVRGCFQMGQAIYNFASSAVTTTVTFFMLLPGRLANIWTSILTHFITWSVQFGVGVKNWAVGAFNTTITWFQRLPGRVAGFFTSLWHQSGRAWSNFNVALARWLIDTYNSVVTWFGKLPSRVYNLLIDVYNNAITAFDALVMAAANFGLNVYNGFTGWVEQLPNAVWDAINNTISAFNQMVGAAWDSAKNFGQGLWDGFKHGIGINSPSYIEKAMWAITDVTETETKRLGNHVRTMQQLAGRLTLENPAKAAAGLNVNTIAQMTTNLRQQAAMLQAASTALFPGLSPVSIAARASIASNASASSTNSESPLVQKVVQVTVNNPIAERASDSTSRKLRNLSAMGAF